MASSWKIRSFFRHIGQ